MINERDSVICDVCGDDMDDLIKVGDSAPVLHSLQGLQIDLVMMDGAKEHREYQKLLNVFGKSEFHICFTCWLKSLGVKPKNVEI